jgi:hypothetical protein
MATKKISTLVSEGKILATPDGDEYLYIYEPDGADDANKGLAVKLDTLSSYFSTFVPLTTPLTSTAWDGDSFSTTAKTKIDLSAVFGVPAGVKAVVVGGTIADSSSGGTICTFRLSPNNTDGQAPMVANTLYVANGTYVPFHGTIPCDSGGDIYYQITASGTNTMVIILQIWGYWL